jgi:hypothetical protein
MAENKRLNSEEKITLVTELKTGKQKVEALLNAKSAQSKEAIKDYLINGHNKLL